MLERMDNMGISFIYNKTEELTDLNELVERELVKDAVSSNEGLSNLPSINTGGCDPEGPGRKQEKGVFFIKVKNSTGNYDWTFFLKDVSESRLYNDFIMLMADVNPKDTILIYGPSQCSTNVASFISSAIISCPCKNIKVCTPYVFNVGAAYILSFAPTVVYSPYDIMVCRLDEIVVGGGLWDAKSTLKMHNDKFDDMFNRLIKVGFLTQEEVTHIRDKQGQVVVYTDDLVKRYKTFNARKK